MAAKAERDDALVRRCCCTVCHGRAKGRMPWHDLLARHAHRMTLRAMAVSRGAMRTHLHVRAPC